ncbi:unnamed protein product [Chrysoparadoxa australica]
MWGVSSLLPLCFLSQCRGFFSPGVAYRAPTECIRYKGGRTTPASWISRGAGEFPAESDSSHPASNGRDLAGRIESSFIEACASGDYQGGMKSFIRAIISAYESGYSVPSITLELSMHPGQSAGRPLMAEETELRQLWMTLVYLTLEKVRWPQFVEHAARIDPPFKAKFELFVENIVEARRRGYDLERLKLEEMMRGGGSGAEGEPRTPVEAAVLSQSMRVVFLTLSVTREGWSGSGST